MKAGVASPNGVVIQDVPEPKPKPTDLLVKVKAIALNRADLGSAKGDTSHGAAAGKPIGSEFSGEVIEVGADVRDFKKGDRVMCHSPGSHAEMAVSDYGRAMKIPDGMGYEQAATLPIGLNTLHNALVTAGRLKAGESVMVQGASSGVGIIGLQIAKLMGAKFVVGTSTNDARRAKLKDYGADLAVSTKDPTWPEQVLKATGGKGLDLTVYIGVTFRTRTIEEVREILIKMRADLWDDVKTGRIKVPIDKTYPLADAKAGHEHMRTNQHFGKILLIP